MSANAVATKSPAAHLDSSAKSAPASKKGCDLALPSGFGCSNVSKEAAVSGAMGAAVGVAARRLTSDALYGVGLCFAGLQCLSYLGFITIHWNIISDALEKVADQNKDGKLDMEDAKILWHRFMKCASCGLPSAAGFTSGFMIGYKYFA
ncbi:putative transmembrane protein [Leptomonas seymouri]|uniref:Putative transmembrane protein n=1 Tax=Leptomonas seymouri TaxID=5684 RepID=A0A0N0P4B0_LEPSE|nr:putative transmembrane protein [Leptomonas seymouri]|eukprot:KPI85086.1 putative transmembrane protein [Leptomonas seymouri]